ncbi:PQQ-binding-like beta-propeller repeat protein [Opitutaceae bacterium]|nr:PQQ-binding-like beta-propeller repeat protein [Opitutaceae bacterium]
MRLTRFFDQGLVATLAVVLASVSAAQTDGAMIWSYSTLSTAATGGIVSSPALGADGTIYFGLEIGSNTSPSGRILAINSNGTEKWTYDTDDWVDATPLVGSDGTVYVGSWNGIMYALDGQTGAEKWTYDTESFIVASAAQGPDGTIYFGGGDFLLHALDPDTGVEKWAYPAEDWIFGSPVVDPSGNIYFGAHDDRFYAIDASGTLIWSALTGGDIVNGAAVMADSTVVFGSREKFVYAINVDGSLRWTYETGDSIDAAPSIGPDGSVMVGSTDGFLYRLSSDGELIWRTNLGAAIYSTPAWREDGSVVVGASDFSLHAVDANGAVIWKYATDDWVDASPVVTGDGRIYITSFDKKLHALHSTSNADLGAEWGGFQRGERRSAWQIRGVGSEGTGRLQNLSVRTQAGSGSATLIAGMVLGGEGSRELLMRGVGPTLADFGVNGALTNPQVTLKIGTETVGSNDDWGDAANVSAISTAASTVGAFVLPAESADAVILDTLGAGARTLQVTGSNGTTGVALVELYDVGGDAGSELINISARSQVGTGADVLIAGFVIDGPTSLLIRGVGPTLADYGVTGVLADPVVQIYRGNQLLAQGNDSSIASDASGITAWAQSLSAFALPDGSKDAVLLVTLPAGVYSALIKGQDGGTGVALAEVYLLPD